MPMTAIMSVIPSDMTRHPPLHERTECLPGSWLHNQMKMIGHETDAEHLDGKFAFGQGKQIEEGRAVAVLVKHGRAAVATIEHMVSMASHLSARNARHRKTTVRQTGAMRQEKVACPLLLLICLKTAMISGPSRNFSVIGMSVPR
jgi:hypothetical protein